MTSEQPTISDQPTRTRPESPLTSSGWTLASIGVVSALLAAVTGWIELGLIAAGCGLALLIAVPYVLGLSDVDIERTIEPQRVEVGGKATAHLSIATRSWAPATPQRVIETIDGQPHVVQLPRLSATHAHESSYPLPTGQRGVFTIGPAYMTRTDPLHVMKRDVGHSATATLWVHPRVMPVASLAAGLAKDLEGPTFDTSPAGDIAFHTVREYSLGDDIRHVHWMSTARAGSLMVRHYVDNRLAQVVTLVDDRSAAYASPADRELAYDIGASITVSLLAASKPVGLRVGSTTIKTLAETSTSAAILDSLAASPGRNDGELDDEVHELLMAERAASVFVLVTGLDDPLALTPIVDVARRSAAVILVQVGTAARHQTPIPGCRTISAASLHDFVRQWDQLAR